MKSFCLITLGCAKNEVDSDLMAGCLIKAGYSPVASPESADFIIVNTCSFIKDAIDESLRVISELAQLKSQPGSKVGAKLIVTGCLVDRFKHESEKLAQGVDLWIPGNMQPELPDILQRIESHRLQKIQFEDQTYIYRERELGSFVRRSYAYIKISEGCNRPCAFCVIPKIRGRFRSRPMDQIILEAEKLLQQGYKELILVAQDLTNYGSDIYGTPSLETLIERISRLNGDFWIRLLYVYPLGVSDKLLDSIINLEKVVKYIDIPFQHSSERMLQLMRRPGGKYSPRRLVDFIRKKSEDIVIRTTFIVGHPGETEADFKDLVQFVQTYELDNVGVFCYSDEPESLSYSMTDKIAPQVAKSRRSKIMRLQQTVSAKRLKRYVGRTVKVLVDGKTNRNYFGRAYFQAPEIDGIIYLDAKRLNVGCFVDCDIKDASVYDLVGKPRSLALVL